ncbi:hypothetical protein [Actinomyces sp. 217892]|nr:hypothetical protein [Actinomyces sp. 217892]
MALLGHVDHLSAFVQGRGRWCATIEWEWRQSRDELSLHHADAAVRGTCGAVIHPQDSEHTDIEALLTTMRRPGDPPNRHRGEAETLVVISHRPDLFGAVFMSDDGGARQRAREEAAVSLCLGTVDLLAYFEVMGKIDRRQAHEDLNVLRRNSRHVRPADPTGYDRLVERLWAKRDIVGQGRRG